jgi:hypothetical protein
MAIQAMALGVQNPEINTMQALGAGQAARQSFDMNNIALAQKGLETVAQVALGAMGGDLNGQADPARFEEGLNYLAQQGVNVEPFRGRPDLAPVVARSGMTALQQLAQAQDEKNYNLALQKFQLDIEQAMQAPAPTADMQNFQLAQENPDFAAHLSSKDAPNPPAQVGEYNFYAQQEKAAGREPMSFLDFQAAQKGGGLTVTTNPDGTTTVQQGGSGGKLTEAQGKDLGFYTRGAQANLGLATLEGQLTDLVQQNAGAAPLGLGNYMRSPEFRQAKVEADNFLTALLRKDTGAAITDGEFNLYGPMFLPIPGDDPATIALKRQKRATALLGLRSGLGTAEIVAASNEAALGLPDPAVEAAGLEASQPDPAPAAPVTVTGAPASAPISSGGEPAKPMSQADYDAIPSGGLFVDPDDGQTYRKP